MELLPTKRSTLSSQYLPEQTVQLEALLRNYSNRSELLLDNPTCCRGLHERRVLVTSLPELLILHLNRFSVQHTKKQTEVMIPETISSTIIPEQDPDLAINFEIYAAILHHVQN